MILIAILVCGAAQAIQIDSRRSAPGHLVTARVPGRGHVGDDLAGAGYGQRPAHRGDVLAADKPAPVGAEVAGQVLALAGAGGAGRGPAEPAPHQQRKRRALGVVHVGASSPSARPRPR